MQLFKKVVEMSLGGLFLLLILCIVAAEAFQTDFRETILNEVDENLINLKDDKDYLLWTVTKISYMFV